MLSKVATRTSSCRHISLKSLYLSHPPPSSQTGAGSCLDFSTVASTSSISAGGMQTGTARSHSPWKQGGSRDASTRTMTSEENTSAPKLPRYIRRQGLQRETQHDLQSSDSKHKQKAGPATGASRVFRSKHYDPAKAQPKEEIRMLEPHVLSARLKKLCAFGKVDEAVSMLKNSPRDAMNTQVWNTLMWECLKVQRYQTAYQLYVDMKRRGFSPTTRTFQTMFTGLSKIEHWSTHTKQLVNARSLYDALQRHIVSLKEYEPDSPDLSVAPIAAYIKILGAAGQYQEIFDVYYAMDSEGSLSADQFTFTAMFQALGSIRHAFSGNGIEMPEGWNAKVAADAKILWTQTIKASKKSPGFPVDPHLVVAAIGALSNGLKAEHDLAFQLAEQYFGLSTDESKSTSGLFPLEPESLGAILRLCNTSHQYSTCLQFYQQVKKRPENIGGVGILDRPHMEEILKARSALHEGGLGYNSLQTLEWMLRQEITGPNGGRIRPAASTFNLVLIACWKCADWASSTTTFDLMTGYHSEDFVDGAVVKEPRYDRRAMGRNLIPFAEAMSTMMRTALATRHRPHIRQCLRILDFIGIDHLVSKRPDIKEMSTKALKNQSFFGSKLAIALSEGVDLVSAHQKECTPEESTKWRYLASRSRQAFDRPSASGYIRTKLNEDIPKQLRRRSIR